MKKIVMKKSVLLTIFFLLCALLAACGKKEDTGENIWRGIAPGTEDLSVVTDRTEYYDLTLKREDFPDPEETGYYFVGAQFFQGEPVRLLAKIVSKGSDIYLYRNGSEPELILQGVPSSYTRLSSSSGTDYQWYLSHKGELYCYHSVFYVEANKADIAIVKFDSNGEVLYRSQLDADLYIWDFCQTEDGRIYLLLEEQSTSKRFLAQLDPDTGELLADFRIDIPYEYQVYLGSAGDSPAVTGYTPNELGQKIMKVNTEDGSLSPIVYFTGTSYSWHEELPWDFQVPEDGRIQIIWTTHYGSDCFWESLQMEKVEKIPIVVRGIYDNDWLANRIAMFNMGNSDYHAVLETCGTANDKDDFSRLTNIQIGSGKGPDILLADLDLDFTELREKGILEDLSPYMEASGIREADYFPFVFASWRQGEHIYSLNYKLSAGGTQIREEMLGSREIPDIETLMDALLAWEGNGIYRSGYDAEDVLEEFLRGTDSLWGMVDWENGTCDFNTPLFGKLLEAARRYGDDGRSTSVSSVTDYLSLSCFFRFDRQSEQEAKGMVTCGILFDDGCYAASYSSYNTMAINANSPNKEGAWELFSYLIGEECQSLKFDLYEPPVNRNVFDKWMEAMIARWGVPTPVNGVTPLSVHYGSDVSEGKQAEYIKAIEEARPLPTRTAPILTIIYDEAKAYFDGYKSAEEVSKAVNNRVKLYLDERK